MTLRPLSFGLLLLLSTSGAANAMSQQVGREQDIVNLRIGQRYMVDDGSCPPGQVKEVLGAKMTPTGVLPSKKCVPRLGPKTKQN